MLARRSLALLLLALFGGSRIAWAQQAAGPQRAGDLWFDPMQLPSFTGTVERYLLNPEGQIDALLFREGPQIVFPPDTADAVRQAAPPGKSLVVWGVRARNAPVITALAFSPGGGDAAPRLIERPYWRLAGRNPQAQAQRLAVAGAVRQPYWSPQGEAVGAVLEDGTVVLLPRGAVLSDEVRDLLKPGAKLAAEGPGAVAAPVEGVRQPPRAEDATPLRALLAERIGESAEAQRPVVTR